MPTLIGPKTALDTPSPTIGGPSDMAGTDYGVNAYVPPAAPTVPKVSTAPVTTPTPTISGNVAEKFINEKIVPTMTSADTAIATNNAKIQADALAKKQTDEAAALKAKEEAVKTGSTDGGPSTEQQILDTPDKGYGFAYQPDGTRVQVPLGQDLTQMGLFATKPTDTKIAASHGGQTEVIPLDGGVGNVVTFTDGTYGRIGTDGTFTPMTADQYKTAKAQSNTYQQSRAQGFADDASAKMEQVLNGTYPLTEDQKSQILAVQQQFARLIEQQALANKNFEGGTQTFQGMLGMSEYSPGIAQGEMKAAIDQGISKISELNTQLTATVAKLKSAFRSENFEMLNDVYKNYSTIVEKKQAELDKITLAAAKYEEDTRNYNLNVEKENNDKAYKTLTTDLAERRLTFDQAKEAADNLFRDKTFDETKRHNIQTELIAWQKERDDAAKAAAAGGTFDPNANFSSTTNTVKNFATTNVARAGLVRDLQDAANRKDWSSYLTIAKNAAKEKMGTTLGSKVQSAEVDLDQLSNMRKLLTDYKNAGGDMGLLRGTWTDINTRLGQSVGDGELQRASVNLKDGFFAYRNAMTGAAFSQKESAQYASVNPQITDNFDLALDKIAGAENYTRQFIDSNYSQNIGKDGYTNLKGLEMQARSFNEVSQMQPEQWKEEVFNAVENNPALDAEVQAMIGKDNGLGGVYDYGDVLNMIRQRTQ